MSDVQAATNAMIGKTYDYQRAVERTLTSVDAATFIRYLDRRSDAKYPTYPGMQRPSANNDIIQDAISERPVTLFGRPAFLFS